jgi:glutamate 5-kinase
MSQTIVVKIGTSSLTQGGTNQLSLATIASLVETLTNLRHSGYRVVLVSSGAVGSRLRSSQFSRKTSHYGAKTSRCCCWSGTVNENL